ncbi:MAG: PAN domain-containing protein [Nitrospirota bacterium]|nr:PAN domain-containing protein [Nitrospirota bacterium]
MLRRSGNVHTKEMMGSDCATIRYLLTTILLGVLVSLPFAAMAAEGGTETLLTTVRLDRPLHFATPSGDPLLLTPGDYVVEVLGTQGLQLRRKDQPPLVISATADRHEEELESPFALAVADESAPTLTHLLLLLPDGRTFQSTGSDDGVMPRMIPTHIVVAVLKSFATGSPVKQSLQIESKSSRFGTTYRTSTLFAGMCALLCQRDEDCRAFTWKRNLAKPVQGICHLMQDAPPKQEDDCCLSGVKPSVAAK